MTPKKKKIYIAVIAVCFSLSAVILYWGMGGGGSSAGPTDPNQHLNIQPDNSGSSNVGSGTVNQGPIEFRSPRVFPNSNTFETEVLKSSAFSRLQVYTGIDPNGQLGRTDPFSGY